METYRNFIAGEWVESSSERTVPNRNPSDVRDVIGTVRLSTAEEVQRAVEAAAEAFPRWRAVPAPERARLVGRARDLLERYAEDVAKALTREEGKILAEARGEVQKTIRILEFFAGEGMRMTGETIPSELPATFCYTLRVPVGVVAAVTPWNFPVAIPFWKSAPALVAGCTVVFKPSTLTPETARWVARIWEEAGAPPGVFNLVYAAGGTAGGVFANDPRVRAITFTGSNEVGMRLYRDASERGKRVQCEMGGKNPVVVLEDADLELAADGIAQGAFGSTGQRCTATSRVVALEPVADRLVKMVCARAEAIRPGETMGPCVDEAQMRTVLEYIEAGRREGARLMCGGTRVPPETGYFVAPTVFDGVTPRMRIAQEEIFGPVVSFLRARSFEEALEIANSVRYGLTSSIYAADPARILRFIESVEAGIVHVNSPTVGGEAQMPFGGMKETGIGPREMGRTAIEFFTEIKTVYWDYTGRRRETKIY